MAGQVFVIGHPLVQHKLTLMRSKDTSTSSFRQLLREISMLLAYEVCRDLPLTLTRIETPIAEMQAPLLDGKKVDAVEYYYRVPGEMTDRDCIIVDPMLATGHSAIAAVGRLKETGPRSIKFVCLLTCPEGIKAFHAAHPDVAVYTASIDERLNEKGYIVPGLGDAGDRLFGTK